MVLFSTMGVSLKDAYGTSDIGSKKNKKSRSNGERINFYQKWKKMK